MNLLGEEVGRHAVVVEDGEEEVGRLLLGRADLHADRFVQLVRELVALLTLKKVLLVNNESEQPLSDPYSNIVCQLRILLTEVVSDRLLDEDVGQRLEVVEELAVLLAALLLLKPKTKGVKGRPVMIEYI